MKKTVLKFGFVVIAIVFLFSGCDQNVDAGSGFKIATSSIPQPSNIYPPRGYFIPSDDVTGIRDRRAPNFRGLDEDTYTENVGGRHGVERYTAVAGGEHVVEEYTKKVPRKARLESYVDDIEAPERVNEGYLNDQVYRGEHRDTLYTDQVVAIPTERSYVDIVGGEHNEDGYVENVGSIGTYGTYTQMVVGLHQVDGYIEHVDGGHSDSGYVENFSGSPSEGYIQYLGCYVPSDYYSYGCGLELVYARDDY